MESEHGSWCNGLLGFQNVSPKLSSMLIHLVGRKIWDFECFILTLHVLTPSHILVFQETKTSEFGNKPRVIIEALGISQRLTLRDF